MDGRLYILSAPSGTGKSTLIQGIRKRNQNIGYSISATTRPQRNGEVHGQDYFFLDEEAFKKKIQEGAFIEWAVVHRHLYGTLWEPIRKQMDEGKKVLLDIDVQGGMQIKKKIKDAVLIFVMPPSLQELEMRLRNRKTEDTVEIEKRLKEAKHEMRYAKKYDFLVINDCFEKTIRDIESILSQT